MPYVKVKIEGMYEVTPGVDGWPGCSTAQDCADVDQEAYDQNLVGPFEVIDWCGDLKVTLVGVEDGSALLEEDDK